ncbi:beta-N-acetylglucosaminidase domain-containing protein [Porphyromonas pogonae]|uniref:beta-N-acetylglucosaminidase domain-containing protein n=1 Tax=Porphyromonas pogonae TaxID=867595 RepID=UPI002E767C5D|nr:beta-N-acetylglucosaminidase domain-containing protein [Porphyromonas pogonae]
MNSKQIISLILFLLPLALSPNCYGQSVPSIHPTPQKVTVGKNTINLSHAVYEPVISAHTDSATLSLIKSNLKTASQGTIKIILGKKGDTHVAKYESMIPQKPEGYYLEVRPRTIVVAGYDDRGTYYGVQTLLSILKSPRVKETTITDYPDVADRGVIEGFYGNPYSHRDRLSQFDFYGKVKLNTYIYGPKDDPYHRSHWRELYPASERNRMKELIRSATHNKVRFVWAIHPGLDIKWTDEDRLAILHKFQDMYTLGVRAFAVFFDDISADDESAKKQAQLLNYLETEFVHKHKDVEPLILCPTQYNQAWANGNYLDILGNDMLPEIRIMWTGKTVVSMIDHETMTWINNRIKRKAYIWLNYPVTDYVVDHLLMGKTYGNSQDIAPLLGGFAANPMEYAEASKVSLFSIADYTWNMRAYRPEESWKAALPFLMPSCTEAFKIFCENNVDLGPNGHRFRMEGESMTFRKVSEAFTAAYDKGTATRHDAAAVIKQFDSFINSCHTLLHCGDNPELVAEMKPWIEVLDLMSRRGKLLFDMQRYLEAGNPKAFIETYKNEKLLEQKQLTIRSRDFKGSINAPYPKPANEVVAPFIDGFKRKLLASYRKKYTYALGELPVNVIENGKYYIKYQGKYLSNIAGNKSNKPELVSAPDSINPQRQIWELRVQEQTGRYKITSTQDQRNLNTKLELQEGDYNPTAASFVLWKQGNKYAIQNSPDALSYFWKIEKDKLRTADNKIVKNDNYVFEIIPVGKE